MRIILPHRPAVLEASRAVPVPGGVMVWFLLAHEETYRTYKKIKLLEPEEAVFKTHDNQAAALRGLFIFGCYDFSNWQEGGWDE